MLSAPKKAGIKNLILNQKIVSGIVNAYIHDILFMCGIHPLTRADKLNSEQIMDLYNSCLLYTSNSLGSFCTVTQK